MWKFHVELFFERIAIFAKIDKESSGRFRFFCEWRNRHKAFDRKSSQREQRFHLGAQFVWFESEFAPLACDIDLEQNPWMHPLLFRDSVHLAGEIDIVDAVKEFEQWKGVTDFVLLQMSDEMPAQTGRQLRNLSARFLHFAFPKQ